MENSSNQWQALTLAFPIIGKFLAWKVGSRYFFRVNVDAISGCSEDVLLPNGLVNFFQEYGQVTLNRFSDPTKSSIWAQGWLSTVDLGL